MLFDTSYTDKRITRQINEVVGKPYGWKNRWKMGGIGSRRMVIQNISESYQKYLNADHYISNANIELRPKGIIIHFRHKLQSYSWIMPYNDLAIEYDDTIILKSNREFVSFAKDLDTAFITKMIAQFDAYQQ